MRAQFKVTEISHTTRGVTILYLDANFDGSIPKENRLAVGNSPKGELSIEVDPKWADANVTHGSTFTFSTGLHPAQQSKDHLPSGGGLHDASFTFMPLDPLNLPLGVFSLEVAQEIAAAIAAAGAPPGGGTGDVQFNKGDGTFTNAAGINASSEASLSGDGNMTFAAAAGSLSFVANYRWREQDCA